MRMWGWGVGSWLGASRAGPVKKPHALAGVVQLPGRAARHIINMLGSKLGSAGLRLLRPTYCTNMCCR